MSSSPTKSKQKTPGFFKAIVQPRHKKNPSVPRDDDVVIEYIPTLPPLDFNPNANTKTSTTLPHDKPMPSPSIPGIDHKKSSSNVSMKNMFGENKRNSKYNKEDMSIVQTETAIPSDKLPQIQERRLDGMTPINNILVDRTPHHPPRPEAARYHQTPIYHGEKNKENWPIQKFDAQGKGKADLAKPLPPLAVQTQFSSEDEIRLYTPKVYSASSQRNFFDYDVSLRPRPQSVAVGERKSSWSSITSLGRPSSIKAAGRTSVEMQRGRNISGSSTVSQRRPSSSFAGTTSSVTSASSAGSHLQQSSLSDVYSVEDAFEALLDARGIPQNMRSKLRGLDTHVKADFIKQDKEEAINPSMSPVDMPMRGMTRPQTRGRSRSPQKRSALASISKAAGATLRAISPTKRSFDARRGDEPHNRDKSRGFNILKKTTSSTSLANLAGDKLSRKRNKKEERPDSSYSSKDLKLVGAFSGSTHSLVPPTTPTGDPYARGPEDYIKYLKDAKPDTAEVGWLHRLKQLLRNERLSWIEAFLNGGGFDHLVRLLYSLLDIEWRDEHHEKLLDWCLICLKAVCTSPPALACLDKTHSDLFHRLVDLLFDPERKGPSEFNTRGLISGLLLTWLSTAPQALRGDRAHELLSILADPEPRESTRPVDFIDAIRVRRPYKRWCKEVTDVTKEVFWIFLHHQNVIPYLSVDETVDFSVAYFPTERPPVAAAPYVGGVEWEATNYLASHLDILNAIIASLPSSAERNNLRMDLRNCGWEKVMGGTLRIASTKFYGSIHEGLKTWVSAARVDKWESTAAVRSGIFAEDQAPKKQYSNAGAKKKQNEEKVELPKLEFEMKGRIGGPEDAKATAIKVDKEGEADLGWQF